ncbi:MAG: CBS domain-containing protein [Nitrospinota bacterium]
MLVKEIMKTSKDVITCSANDYVVDAAKKMEEHNIGCILVMENGKLNGILTDRDIALAVVARGKNSSEVKVSEIMKTQMITGRPNWDLSDATKLMAEKKIRRLPIQSNGRLEGFISLADIAPIFKKELDSFLDIEASPIKYW